MKDTFNISKWKMTSIFWQMEDDLNMWTYKGNLNVFGTLKITSKCKATLILSTMEDNLKSFAYGR